MKDKSINYVFDVDGTLTPSRQPIDPDFGKWFLEWCQTKYVFIISGSDHEQIREQLGVDIFNTVDGVFGCNGNTLHYKDNLIYQHNFELTVRQREYIENLLEKNRYPIRTGNHIEERTGMVNFSIVGRNATYEERQDYIEYDRGSNDRHNMARKVMLRYPELEAQLGGETGIDIFPKGKNKSQVCKRLDPFIFFGDKVELGGNDHAIARLARTLHTVKSWENTRDMLLQHYNY